MNECIACKYGGRDDAQYRAYGCPECVCPKEISDTDRLEWMIESQIREPLIYKNKFDEWLVSGKANLGFFKTPREAIDSAMGKGNE